MQQIDRQNLTIQKWVTAVSVILLVIKFAAYFLTHSVAILTDALESIVNVAAGFIGVYSLSLVARPRDIHHPYGYGKAEFISAAIEGTLIGAAGILIIYKAIMHFINPVALHQLNEGIYLVTATALINLVMGIICVQTGKRNNSVALIASGRHLQTDTLTTVGIIAGLLLVTLTGYLWIDGAVAIIFGAIIIYNGYKIVRGSVSGIMDKADMELLGKMALVLNDNRRENWVDLHNLRVIKYGNKLHVDCHLTVPWYLNVHEAHSEIDKLTALIKDSFGSSLEMFVHSDGCMPFSCHICNKQDCSERKFEFKKKIEFTLDNISRNQRHGLT